MCIYRLSKPGEIFLGWGRVNKFKKGGPNTKIWLERHKIFSKGGVQTPLDLSLKHTIMTGVASSYRSKVIIYTIHDNVGSKIVVVGLKYCMQDFFLTLRKPRPHLVGHTH